MDKDVANINMTKSKLKKNRKVGIDKEMREEWRLMIFYEVFLLHYIFYLHSSVIRTTLSNR